MTPDELLKAMQQLLTHRDDAEGYQKPWKYDPETGHKKADDLMVATLRSLGYGAAMDIYEGETRWYA